jgi:RNA processing factor Prp31
MQELIASFTYEQKDRFIQTGEMELNTVELGEIKAQELLEKIEIFNKDFEIRTEALWKDTLNFAKSISNVASLGKLGPALGIGAVVLAGAITYVDSRNKNMKIKDSLLQARTEIRNAITETQQNKSKAENFVKRADELCDYLDESMKRYSAMFTEIYGQLFPEGDKTKSERETRKKEGGEYYTDEEFMIIRPLGKYAKVMGQVIKADI